MNIWWLGVGLVLAGSAAFLYLVWGGASEHAPALGSQRQSVVSALTTTRDGARAKNDAPSRGGGAEGDAGAGGAGAVRTKRLLSGGHASDEPASREQARPDRAPGHAGKVIPHPVDEARQRMNEQRRLFAELKDAIHVRDFSRARALLQQHDESFSAQEAWDDVREGYQLILDCQQYPSMETRARGARFVREQRGSTMRRSVRRACSQQR